jgi:hypothetical protein
VPQTDEKARRNCLSAKTTADKKRINPSAVRRHVVSRHAAWTPDMTYKPSIACNMCKVDPKKSWWSDTIFPFGRKTKVVIHESPWAWMIRTSRYVALLSMVTRKRQVCQIEIQKTRPAVVMTIEQHTARTPSRIVNPVPETCCEVVWELKSQTSSWTEDYPQCSHQTPSKNQLHHPPCSKQSLSRAQTI